MMYGSRQWASVAVLLAACACQSGPRVLRDTEGRTFQAICSREGDCKLQQKAGPQRVDRPAQVLMTGGRLVGICDVTADEPPRGPYDCRPLACESDADCPPAHGMKDGQCLNRRCSDPAEAISTQDAIMLCLSGTGLGRETPPQIERYALALNCGKPCKVPAPCPQP